MVVNGKDVGFTEPGMHMPWHLHGIHILWHTDGIGMEYTRHTHDIHTACTWHLHRARYAAARMGHAQFCAQPETTRARVVLDAVHGSGARSRPRPRQAAAADGDPLTLTLALTFPLALALTLTDETL